MSNLQSNLAAELRARKVYEELHRHVHDRGAREVFDFLIQREEAHASLFMEAIERAKELGELKSSFGDKEYSRMYGDLSVGGPAADMFRLEPNPRVITGPFTGDPDKDTFGGLQPPMRQ